MSAPSLDFTAATSRDAHVGEPNDDVRRLGFSAPRCAAQPCRNMPGMRSLSALQPVPNARNGFAHVGGRARVAEAHEVLAVDRVETDAGGGGDARLFQHALAKVEAVVGK